MEIETVYHFLSIRWAKSKEMDDTSEKTLLLKMDTFPQESNLTIFIRL